jgi:nicotinate phosphoribosyltransferase
VISGDLVSLADEQHDGEMLLQRVMSGGRRTMPAVALDETRAHARDQLARLPAPLKRLEAFSYPVEISNNLRELAERLDGIQNVSANAQA